MRPAGPIRSSWTFRGCGLRTRAGLSDFPAAVERLPEVRGLEEPERALAFVGALLDDDVPAQHGTTNVSVLDDEGNACVLTTSLGLGSGDFVPGCDLHLNSMLGEADLFTEGLEPGDRMASMMAPTLALDGDNIVLAAGAAGGTRLRSALLQVVAGILDEGLDPQAAVDRPRVHPAGTLVHLESGFGPATVAALESAGFAGSELGLAAPLLRRGQRRHADRLCGRPAAKRRRSGRLIQGRVAARVRSTSRAIWSISACSLSNDCSSRSRFQSSTISRRP